MSLGKEVASALPYLRRFARAIKGSQQVGDVYVRKTLEQVLEDPDLLEPGPGFRVSLYKAFLSEIGKISTSDNVDSVSSGDADEATILRLNSIPQTPRMALILSTLEDFSLSDTAQILGLEEKEASDAIQIAVDEIDRQNKSNVLIIEDEPLIAMQLQTIVEKMGHSVIGVASTRSEAISLARRKHPDLIVADISLADGSSGVEAVEQITMKHESVTVFVTAYPERLLTGVQPEPTYLVTKPYAESTVRAAISQALFFGASKPKAITSLEGPVEEPPSNIVTRSAVDESVDRTLGRLSGRDLSNKLGPADLEIKNERISVTHQGLPSTASSLKALEELRPLHENTCSRLRSDFSGTNLGTQFEIRLHAMEAALSQPFNANSGLLLGVQSQGLVRLLPLISERINELQAMDLESLAIIYLTKQVPDATRSGTGRRLH